MSLTACSLPGVKLDGYNDAQPQPVESKGVNGRKIDYIPTLRKITPALIARQHESAVFKSVSSDGHPGSRKPRDYEYQVGPGDVLTVIVWEHPELTNPAGITESLENSGRVVHADGTIFFPYAGVVDVAGHTVVEIRRMLAESLKRVIRQPQVDVRVLAYRSKKAYIVGNIARPCKVQITDQPINIVDALNQCQSLVQPSSQERQTDTSPVSARTIRLVRDGRSREIDLQNLYLGKGPGFGMRLHDQDRLYVEDNTWDRVFMVGEFEEQTALPIPTSGLTLSESISDAGGLNLQSADSGRIFVIRGLSQKSLSDAPRQDDSLSPTIYQLDASSADGFLLADQFDLQPRDVVFASAADLVNFNRALAQILPSVQLLFQSRFLINGGN